MLEENFHWFFGQLAELEKQSADEIKVQDISKKTHKTNLSQLHRTSRLRPHLKSPRRLLANRQFYQRYHISVLAFQAPRPLATPLRAEVAQGSGRVEVPWRLVSCDAMLRSCHTISCHVMSCHVMSC